MPFNNTEGSTLLWRRYLAVACSVSEHKSSNLVILRFISVFRVIFHCRSLQAGIIKLEWWVEANAWKKPEVRDDLTVIGTPKLFVWKHNGYTCQLSRFRRESHACGLKTSISRWLTLAGQFLAPVWEMGVVAVLVDTISKNKLTQNHVGNDCLKKFTMSDQNFPIL